MKDASKIVILFITLYVLFTPTGYSQKINEVDELIERSSESLEDNLNESLRYARRAYRISEESNSNCKKSESILQYAFCLVECSSYDSAKTLLDTYSTWFKLCNDKQVKALARNLRARLQLRSSNYELSKKLCHINLALVNDTLYPKFPRIQYKTLSILANCHKYQGNYDSSEYYFKMLLTLGQKSNDDKMMAQFHQDYATHLLDRNEYGLARHHTSQAFQLSHDRFILTETRSRANLIRVSLAETLEQELELNADSLRYFQNELVTCAESFLEMGRTRDATKVHNTIATLHMVLGNYKTSLQYYFKALNGFETTKDSANMARVYLNLGNAYEQKESFDSSIQYYHLTFGISKRRNAWIDAKMAAEGLAYSYEAIGKLERALYYQRECQWIQERRVFNKEKEQAVQKYREKYKAEATKVKMIQTKASEEFFKNRLKVITIIAIALSVVLVVSLLLIRSYSKSLKSSKRIHQLEVQELVRKKDQQREGARLEGQDAERKKIARDLHDEIGGTLCIIQTHLSALSADVELFRIEEREQYDRANLLLGRAVDQVRNISRNMMASTLSKFGLMAALHDLADSVNATQQLNFKLLGNEENYSLESSSEFGIFRVVQELASNTLKYAEATEIRLELIQHNTELSISYEDNGIGFNLTKAESRSGIGLRNIRARVAQMNGTMSIETFPRKGALFMINIPNNNYDQNSFS